MVDEDIERARKRIFKNLTTLMTEERLSFERVQHLLKKSRIDELLQQIRIETGLLYELEKTGR